MCLPREYAPAAAHGLAPGRCALADLLTSCASGPTRWRKPPRSPRCQKLPERVGRDRGGAWQDASDDAETGRRRNAYLHREGTRPVLVKGRRQAWTWRRAKNDQPRSPAQTGSGAETPDRRRTAASRVCVRSPKMNRSNGVRTRCKAQSDRNRWPLCCRRSDDSRRVPNGQCGRDQGRDPCAGQPAPKSIEIVASGDLRGMPHPRVKRQGALLLCSR